MSTGAIPKAPSWTGDGAIAGTAQTDAGASGSFFGEAECKGVVLPCRQPLVAVVEPDIPAGSDSLAIGVAVAGCTSESMSQSLVVLPRNS
jgi:hypothetical protein